MSRSYSRILFFNDCNNGDNHYSRQFLRHISSLVGVDCAYSHFRCDRILADLPMRLIRVDTRPLHQESFHLNADGTLFMNTWVGHQNFKWFTPNGCTLHNNYRMFSDNCKAIGVTLPPEVECIPTIDYARLGILGSVQVDRNILVSNGPCASGQAYNFDMNPVVEALADKHPSCRFFVTDPFTTNRVNIFDANKTVSAPMGKSNLVELSHFSLSCPIIVGRGSGPFCFSHVRENLMDPEKTFIVFGNGAPEGHWVTMADYNLPQHAKQLWGECHVNGTGDCFSLAFDMIDGEINAKFGSR
jgi:hypothetical protein